jgi:hypothetical protein
MHLDSLHQLVVSKQPENIDNILKTPEKISVMNLKFN